MSLNRQIDGHRYKATRSAYNKQSGEESRIKNGDYDIDLTFLNYNIICKSKSRGYGMNVGVTVPMVISVKQIQFCLNADASQCQSLQLIIVDNILRWTVNDIKNVNLILGCESVKAIPFATFDSPSSWYESFVPFAIDELRAELECCIIKSSTILNGSNHNYGYQRSETSGPACVEFSLKRSNVGGNQYNLEIMGTEHDLESTHSGTVAMFIKTTSSADNINSEFTHFFCYISKTPDESEYKTRIDALESNESKQLISDEGDGWKLVLLDVPLFTTKRTLRALTSCKIPILFKDIISCQHDTNQSFPFEDLIRASISNELFSRIASKCNKSQKEAIFACIGSRGYPAIKIIHGPPGTGKTSTVVTILRLYLSTPDLTIHATAPTNIAVCELARRFVKRFVNRTKDKEEYNDVKPADILIIEDISKLGLKGGLELFSLDLRLERLYDNIANIESIYETICEFQNPEFMKDIYEKKKVLQPDISSPEFINEYLLELSQRLDCSASGLLIEHPSCSFSKRDMKMVLDDFNTFQQLPHHILSTWIQHNQQQQHNNDNDDNNNSSSCDNFLSSTLRHLVVTVGVLRMTIEPADLRREVITRARLIFSTVMAGGRKLFDDIPVDIVVIDEATQLVEAQTSVLFRESLQCLVLVGDNKQLPATTMSTHPLAEGYKRSLFDRLIDNNYPSYLLNIQYRMHPDISRWPRVQFYEGKIKDGDNVKSADYCKPWHHTIPPFSIYDIASGKEETDAVGSKFNKKEELAVRKLLSHIRKTVGDIDKDTDKEKAKTKVMSIGIISPYQAQVKLLKPLTTVKDIHVIVKSIEDFQGQYCDIVIFTAVTTNAGDTSGFLSDTRRLNVALTRARYALIVLCNGKSLESNSTWRDMIEYAKTSGQYMNESNSTIIQSINKNNNKIFENFSELKSLFENSLWKIQFNNDFFVSIRKQDKSSKSKIISELLQLSQGQWHSTRNITTNEQSGTNNNNSNSNNDNVLLQVLKINDLSLFWSVDIRGHESSIQGSTICYEQEIKVWNLVSDAQIIDQVRRRILRGMESFSEDRVKMSLQVAMNSETGNCQPMSWSKYSDFQLTTNTIENKDKLETSETESATTLMKFYPLSSSFAERLISSNESMKLDLPFTMSSEEESIVSYPGSLFILGRSGTGKTTVMLRRMYIENLNSLNLCHSETEINDIASSATADEIRCCRQMLVTASPILCEAIRKSYKALCDSSSSSSSSTTSSSTTSVAPAETEINQENENNNDSEIQRKLMRAVD
eukprot:gene8009-16395_t